MIDIVFSEADAEVLKGSMTKSCFANNENFNYYYRERICGKKEQVLSIEGYFDIGVIDTFDSENRKKVFYEMKGLYESDSEVEAKWQRYLDNVQQLIQYAENKETFRICYSHTPDCLCGFYFVCNILHKYKCNISKMEIPEMLTRSDRRLIVFNNIHELDPGLLYNFLPYERKLNQMEIGYYASCWEGLIEDPSCLRAVINGTVLGVSIDFYDFMIRKVMPYEKTKLESLLGKILFELPVHEAWIRNRIKHFIDTKQLQVIIDQDERDMIIYKEDNK